MSITRILERHERTYDALLGRLEAIPDPLWTWRPGPDAWCAAEVYDHVDRIARLYSIPNLEACLRGEGRRRGGRTFLGWLVLLLPSVAGAFRVRRDFPEAMIPAVIPKEKARRELEGLRQLARNMAPRVAGARGGPKVKHVSLGWLDAAQWYAFAEFHSRHHLEGQLARILAAWEHRDPRTATTLEV